MKTSPIVPAAWCFDETHAMPRSTLYNDVYYPAAGALAQARHVFLAGNDLPARWRQRDRFVVLETGFGLGNNFLATWDAWRRDPQQCARLHFLAIERHPFVRPDLTRVHAESPLPNLADRLISAWPPLTPNLHRLSFEGGRVQLLLALGDVADWLPQFSGPVDAFFLDGFAPARNPEMWQPRLFKAMARLAAAGATAATWTAARAVRTGLKAAGFDARLALGTGGKRDITLATFDPPFKAAEPRRIDARRRACAEVTASDKRVLVVGAGLAGCATAWALAEQGWKTTLLDRRAAPAEEASGNPGGLFHGIFNVQDGVHARFNRAAALEAQRVVTRAIVERRVAGCAAGLLRLELLGNVAAMRQQGLASGLPPEYLQALSAEEASRLVGLPLQHPGWLFSGGGWVSPAGLATAFLSWAGAATAFHGGLQVQRIARRPDAWEALDAKGRTIASAPTLVLANAHDALRLLGHPAWLVRKVRGQISLCTRAPDLPWPRLPLAGAGYVLPAIGSTLLFGATTQADDDDASVRETDHVHNLAQLRRLTDGALADVRLPDLKGRTGWRLVSGDRLPIIGAVPFLEGGSDRQGAGIDRAERVPRTPGLFVFTALGSRGITWAALGAQLVASSITGAPAPVERSLLDAVDPARFIARAARRAAGAHSTAVMTSGT